MTTAERPQAGARNEDNLYLQRIQRHSFTGAWAGKLFHVGSAGSSLNFHSQQKRALNLANLFFEACRDGSTLSAAMSDCERKFLPENLTFNSKIAIVGGGIAGVSTAVFLALLGFQKIEIIECAGRILTKQKNASHRHAHPSYNDWPISQSKAHSGPIIEFSSTTAFPAFNWFAASADQIVSHLEQDELLQALTEPRKGSDPVIKLKTSTLVRSISLNRKESEFEIEGRNAQGEKSQQITTSQFTIIATGLGEERETGPNPNKYWWKDNLEMYKHEQYNYEKSNFTVRGNGDGGLIDFIRLCLDPEKSESNFALEFIAYLRHKKYRDLCQMKGQIPAGQKSHKVEVTEFEMALANLSSNASDEEWDNLWGTIDSHETFGVLGDAEESQDKFNALRASITDASIPGFRIKEYCHQIRLERREGDPIFVPNASLVNKAILAFMSSFNITNNTFCQPTPAVETQTADDTNVLIKRIGVKKWHDGMLFLIDRAKAQDDMAFAAEDTDTFNWREARVEIHNEMIDTANAKLGAGKNYLNYIQSAVSKYLETFFPGAESAVILDNSTDLRPGQVTLFYSADRHNTEETFCRLGGFDTALFGIPIQYQPLETSQNLENRWKIENTT